MLKAFRVQDEWGEGNACVIFHTSNAAARRLGANEIDSEWETVSCTRAPQFDQYAELGRVPALAMLADGWWFNCPSCGKQVQDDVEEAGPPPVINGLDEVFCSRECCDALAAKRAEHQQYIEAGKAEALRRWKGVTITSAYGSPETIVEFTLPHAPEGRGQIRWLVGSDGVGVSPRDLPLWEAYLATLETP